MSAEPLALSISDAVRMSGIGRTSLIAEIRHGRLRAIKIGKRTVVTVEDLRSWLASRPAFKSRAA